MPKWGLTREQIEAEPWGISAKLLRPSKTITDPVHGDIYLNKLETLFVDSPPMQRLRRVRQLGTTQLVYPGATQSRFSHALGTLRAAQDLLDAVMDNRNGPRPAHDFFEEWSTRPDENGTSVFDRRWAEVTVVTRLGGLLHDFCHVPFGHTIEDDLKILIPHDRNFSRFRFLWAQLPQELRDLMKDLPALRRHLIPLAMSKDPDTGETYDQEQLEYPFVADIVGNTICADLIDYLHRDHLFTGLPIALGTRFANDFYVSRAELVDYPKRMVIRITRGGTRRVDILTELLKYLRFRYELSERVINHHAKLAADAMMDKLLEMWSDWLWVEKARAHKPDLVESYGHRALGRLKDELAKLPVPEPEPFAVTKPLPQENGEATNLSEALFLEVRKELEEEFVRRSDDGIIEYLRDWGSTGDEADTRRAAIGALANAILNRELFKLIGRADSKADRAKALKKYQTFGPPDARRRLEEGAAESAGLAHRWHVVVWVPSADMRLKVAEVLIEEDGKITPLDRAGYPGVEEIYEHHQNLWAINVYAHPTVSREGPTPDSDVLLAYLGEEMGVEMRRRDGSPVGSLVDLAAARLADEYNLRGDDVKRLSEVAAHTSSEENFQPGKPRSFDQVMQRVRFHAESEGVIPSSS